MLGATETLIEAIVKVCREDTIFYLFFPYFFCPLPNEDCKTVTLFLRIQVNAARAVKKRSRAKLHTEGESWEES